MDESFYLFEEFKARGGSPDSTCYNGFMTRLSNANRGMEAYEIFEEARSKGCKQRTFLCGVGHMMDIRSTKTCFKEVAVQILFYIMYTWIAPLELGKLTRSMAYLWK